MFGLLALAWASLGTGGEANAAPATFVQEAAGETRVRQILVEGNERYSDSQLVGATGLASGDVLSQEELDRALEVLFETFRVRAEFFVREVGGGSEVDLLLRVAELALDLEPRFVGNRNVSTEEVWSWAGLAPGSQVYLYQAASIRERLLGAYRREGYTFVEVNVVERPGGIDEATGAELAPDVIFEIKEGPRVRVREVKLHGNTFEPDRGFLFLKKGISKLADVELRGPWYFNLFAKKYVAEELDGDVVALRQVYRDYGFLDAVVKVERLEFSEKRDWVTIHIAIDEGPRYTVGSVSVEAIEVVTDPAAPERQLERPQELIFPEEELLGRLEVKVGDFFLSLNRQADERALRTFYAENGYIDHPSLPASDRWRFFDPILTFDQERPVVHVNYRITQGRQQFIREVRIRGNAHTQDRVIRRLITVEPGDVADPREIERARQRIQGTSFFSDPRNLLDHREPTYRYVATEDPNWKDLEFIVEEGQDLTFNISGGVSSNLGAFGVISMTKRNFDILDPPSSLGNLIPEVAARRAFNGAGQELRIQASPGTERSFFDIYFREPDVFYRHVDRISLSLNANRRLRIFRSHDEERERLGFSLGRQIGADSSFFAGYYFGEIDVDDLDAGGEPGFTTPFSVPSILKAQEGKNDLAYFDLGYSRNTLDSRISPRNGSSMRLSAELYDDTWGSDFDFVKTEFAFDWYDEFDDTRPGWSDRYHLGLRGGAADAFGNSDNVPYTERYFLGGQRTLRGFDFRGVGPYELGLPIGGETYLYATAEYRRPLVTQTQPGTYRELETMHWGLFVDVGVLDPDSFSLDFSELRASAGLLFGLSVPLPITFSFGFPIEEGEGDETRVLGFNIGI